MTDTPKTIHLHYYAILREQRSCCDETITTTAPTAEKLYNELQEKYGLSLSTQRLRVSVNDAFQEWDTVLKSGDHIVFIPPVAGG